MEDGYGDLDLTELEKIAADYVLETGDPVQVSETDEEIIVTPVRNTVRFLKRFFSKKRKVRKNDDFTR